MMLLAPLATFWIGGLLLSLADGRRRGIAAVAALLLGAGLVANLVLARAVLAGGSVEMVAGNWPEGVGITLRADALGVAFALTASAVIFVAFCFEMVGGIESRSFPALSLFLAAGLTGLFLTGDAFNFYVFFEIAMISSYILAAYGEERRQLRAAVIFAVVNLLGSVIFLIGIVLSLSRDWHPRYGPHRGAYPVVEETRRSSRATLLFVALAVEAGHLSVSLLAASVYTGVHASVAAMFSGALATIGAYGMLRIGAGMLPRELALSARVLVILGVASIIYGGLQSVSRHETSAVIAYSSIGQVGYILIAVAIGGQVGLTAAVLYTLINSPARLSSSSLGLSQGGTLGWHSLSGVQRGRCSPGTGVLGENCALSGHDPGWQRIRTGRPDRHCRPGRSVVAGLHVPVLRPHLLARIDRDRESLGGSASWHCAHAGGPGAYIGALAGAAGCAE
jgi:multicomponent Na+:H+ antiporter subunit D